VLQVLFRRRFVMRRLGFPTVRFALPDKSGVPIAEPFPVCGGGKMRTLGT